MRFPNTTTQDLRDAALLLIEATSSLGQAVSELREATNEIAELLEEQPGLAGHLGHFRRRLVAGEEPLSSAWEKLEEAGRRLGGADE